jgi:hypothetical protein
MKGATYRVWPVLPDMVATAVARLESTSAVEITSMESAHLSGQSYFDDIPGHLVLLRGLNRPLGVKQEAGTTVVLSPAWQAKAVAWPLIAKLPSVPSHVYIVCVAMGG